MPRGGCAHFVRAFLPTPIITQQTSRRRSQSGQCRPKSDQRGGCYPQIAAEVRIRRVRQPPPDRTTGEKAGKAPRTAPCQQKFASQHG